MAPYRAHISNAVSAAIVQGTDALQNIVRADEREGAGCLEALHEGRDALLEVLAAVYAAIEAETGKNPTATPVIRRIQAVAKQAGE